MYLIGPKPTVRQKNFIMGTILGGSSVVLPKNGKNSYLSMRGKNELWIRYKATELINFSSENPITKENTNRWHSLCYPIFNEYRRMFYDSEGHRNIADLDQLGLLTDVGFMVWFMDSGEIEEDFISFNTNIWGSQGTESLGELMSLIGCEHKIWNKRGSLRLAVDRDYMWDIIQPQLPACFR